MAVDFFAGCLGGCAGVLVGHPFDTVKVRLQTQDSNNKVYRGTFHCLHTIVKQESYQGLFKGMSSPMAGLAAVNAIVFGVYGNMVRGASDPSLPTQFLAGSTAGLVQSLVTSPMELAKTRLQLQGQERRDAPFWQRRRLLYRNPWDCLSQAFRAEGLRGVYRGLGCTVLRDAPAFGVYFAGYEALTRLIADPRGNVATLPLLFAGGLAGMLSWVVIYPLDVLKSRLQADGLDGAGRRYAGLLDCARQSYRAEGWRVFAKGLNSTLIRAFPTNAATFGVVTWVIVMCEAAPADTGDVLLLDQKMQPLAC